MNNPTMKIEKNIPIPSLPERGFTTKALRLMEIGDSIVVSSHNKTSWHPTASHIGIKITLRKISDTEIRVWRTA